MAIPAGLHIGTSNGIVLTWDGATVSNSLNLDTDIAPAAGKTVVSMEAYNDLFAGLSSVAEVWQHDGATWAKVIDASATNIKEISDIKAVDKYIYCLAVDEVGGGSADGTEIWRWDFVAGGAAPTAAFSSISSNFRGYCLLPYESYLACGGTDESTGYAKVFYSIDSGASWNDSYFPYEGTPITGRVNCLIEHSDGYVYAFVHQASSTTVWKTNNFTSWEKVYTNSTYVPLDRSAISFNDYIYAGGQNPGNGSATYAFIYNGTSWSFSSIHGTARLAKAMCYFTDGSASTPQLWVAGADDLLSYDGSSWSVEDSGSTTEYRCLAGAMSPAGSVTWRLPPSGTGIDTSTTLSVEGLGASTDIRIYKDTVLDTSNWSFTYTYDRTTRKTGASFKRSSNIAEALTKIDVYVADEDGNWSVVRVGYFYLGASTTTTSYIKKGEAVINKLDGLQYYVAAVRVSGTTRYLKLQGSGSYDGLEVSSTNVARATFGQMISGTDMDLGTPAASPP